MGDLRSKVHVKGKCCYMLFGVMPASDILICLLRKLCSLLVGVYIITVTYSPTV